MQKTSNPGNEKMRKIRNNIKYIVIVYHSHTHHCIMSRYTPITSVFTPSAYHISPYTSPSVKRRRTLTTRASPRTRSPTRFQNLPNAATQHIFSYLNGQNIASVQSTSKDMHRILKLMHPIPMVKIAESKSKIAQNKVKKAKEKLEKASVEQSKSWMGLMGWGLDGVTRTILRSNKEREIVREIHVNPPESPSRETIQLIKSLVQLFSLGKFDSSEAELIAEIATLPMYALRKVQQWRLGRKLNALAKARHKLAQARREYNQAIRSEMYSHQESAEMKGYLDGWMDDEAVLKGTLAAKYPDRVKGRWSVRANRNGNHSVEYLRGYKKGFVDRVDLQIEYMRRDMVR